ncbi:prolyl-tRNA synthetase [Ureaplasma diversum]|uniref:Proline--tRNA ligase n=1 Tax=Ureaplasma diversum TaxID=42094 RepID=A0A0C5RM14_9BACT|nr:proline--tRNA ligase [Ureaplasma diversum]AJQ45437.1 prolyl-tRNA synthetase [Ureaplasma diversum]
MNNNKRLDKITPRSVDFAQWYTDIVSHAKLMQYTDIKGSMVFAPNAWAIWENIRNELDKAFYKLNVRNLAMPTLIPYTEFLKEKDHIEGFAPELFTVTHIGDKKLESPYVIRPTSEILFCNYFKTIVNSYNDLPIKNNQWCSVMRAEKTTRPFLRNSEFHWQELHAIFSNQKEAEEFTVQILDLYEHFFKEFLCIPVLKGVKTSWERFAGADLTYTIEAIMQDGVALQSGTSHYLGQFFAKAYGIKYQNKNNELDYVHQMSAGISTRALGALIMVHADDMGLVLPPAIAPVQISICTLFANKNPHLLDLANDLYNQLSNTYRCNLDTSDKGVGFKLAENEINGTPISIIVAANEYNNNQVMIYRRDLKTKTVCDLEQLDQYLKTTLVDIKNNIYQLAKDRLDQQLVRVNSLEELQQTIANNKVALAFFDGCEADDEKIKALTNASTRCIYDTKQEGVCIITNKVTNKLTVFAKAY